ncbi:hypothetical protein [Mycolicibacterium palauense]|uniref:hypothetical protein n=1 Tax=Mycolicibacterium palauense TaxID=2034511 RepID=UPI000BFED11A|nr:hypothetical protein [Mycolicibacterium palauense]
MCKGSHEPGGPQRCSGDCRAKAARSAAEVTALETRQRALHARIAETSAPAVEAWGPHIGPPPFTPPYAPDFDEWYAAHRVTNPDYRRENAYSHFYNLAGDCTGQPGYSDQTPEQAERAAQRERDQKVRSDRERDAATLGYGMRSTAAYVDAQPPADFSSWSPEQMNDPLGRRGGEPLPGAVDHRRRG